MSMLAPFLSSSTAEQEEIYTYDRLVKAFPENNLPLELWDGKVVLTPAPSAFHQDLVGTLYFKLRTYVESKKLGKVLVSPVDMVLSNHLVVQPDLIFITDSRFSIIQEAIKGAADLIIEVVSPGSRTRDRIEKLDLYSQYGVKEYWIVDPDAATIEVFVFDGLLLRLVQRTTNGVKAASHLLAGFQVDAAELWMGNSR